MKKVTKTTWFKILFLVVAFFLAIGVWYSPIVFKGYPALGISKGIVLARNYYQTGVFADQNDLNVTLATSLIKEKGHSLVLSESLGSFFYAKIFVLTGIPSHNQLILISIILYALVLILLVVLTSYSFGFKKASVFALIYIFTPFSWGLTTHLGEYEFCLIFWSLFFVFYFLAVKKEQQGQSKLAIFLFVISGLLLALSGLSKEVTFVFALALLIFLAVKRFRRQLIYIFIPFICLLLIFWLPSVLSGQNRYLPLFGKGAITEDSIFSHYLHLFPDPYTYYFEKEEFLDEFRNQDLGLSENLETRKVLANYGVGRIGIFDRLKIGTYILFHHIFRFVSLEEFGGPFITLLLILGFVYLRKKSRYIYNLSKYWLIISFLFFSYGILVSRGHLMDFIWLLTLLIVLGLLYLIDIIKNYFKLEGAKVIVFSGLLTGLVLYHFVLVNHAVLGKQYDKDFVPRSLAYAKEISKLDIEDTQVIAIPEDFPSQAYTLNYLTNKSLVIFKPRTFNKLLNENKLKPALAYFGVKYILGYSDELSAKVVEQTGVVNIASNSLEVKIEEVSANKSFLMNLVR